MLRAIEGYVLQKMSQTAFIFLLLHGTSALGKEEIRLSLRLLIPHYVVCKPVGQSACAYLLRHAESSA